MRLIKLTASTFLLATLLFAATGCMKNADKRITREFVNTGIVLSGAQQTPAVPTTALGSMNVFYTRETRTLSYTFNWSGLAGNVTALRIHGPSPTGFVGGVIQTLSTSSIVRCPTINNTTCGSFSGTLFVDGVVVKENDLLNGFFYLNVVTGSYPNGELRGQITFQ